MHVASLMEGVYNEGPRWSVAWSLHSPIVPSVGSGAFIQ